jgi:hypothetical protein
MTNEERRALSFICTAEKCPCLGIQQYAHYGIIDCEAYSCPNITKPHCTTCACYREADGLCRSSISAHFNKTMTADDYCDKWYRKDYKECKI